MHKITLLILIAVALLVVAAVGGASYVVIKRINRTSPTEAPKVPDQLEVIADDRGHTLPLTSVAVSADGKRLATSSQDDTVVLWNFDGKMLSVVKTLPASPSQVALSPLDPLLATGQPDKKTMVQLWDLSGAIPKKGYQTDGHKDLPFRAVFSPSGKLFVSGSYNPTLRLWKIDNQQWQPWQTLNDPPEEKPFRATSLAISADGKTLAAGTDQPRSFRLWSLDKDNLEEWDKTGAWAKLVAFAPKGHALALHGPASAILIWEVKDGKTRQRQKLPGHDGEKNFLNAMAFHPDAKILATAGKDKYVILWDVLKGKELRRQSFHFEVTALAFTPDGRFLALAHADGKLSIVRLDVSESR